METVPIISDAFLAVQPQATAPNGDYRSCSPSRSELLVRQFEEQQKS